MVYAAQRLSPDDPRFLYRYFGEPRYLLDVIVSWGDE